MGTLHAAHASTRRARTTLVGLALLLWPACSADGCGSEGRGPYDGLTMVVPAEPQNLDPRHVGDAWGLRVSRLLFASLVTIDPFTLEVVPELAESVVVEGRTHYRVRLRPDLRFADGTPLDAESVAETFRGVVDPQLGSRYARTYARIERVDVLSPTELVFHLDGPHATFLTDLELPIVRPEDARRSMPETPAGLVGAGPYQLVHRTSGTLRLEENPHWYGDPLDHPKLRLVVIRDANTRALRLLGGAGDAALHGLPPLLLPLFERDARFEVRSVPGPGTAYLGFNVETEELRSPRVRRAIAMAIDREALIRYELHGRAELSGSFIPVGHWAHDPSIAPRPHDPEASRQLLDAAGFPDWNGSEPRMRLTLRTSTDRDRLSAARAIGAMLRDVGIEVDVRPTESASLIADLSRGRFSLTLMELPELIEPHLLSWFFASHRVPGPASHGANRFRYRSSELDRALEEGRTSVGREDRREAYLRAQRILHRDLPALPLFQPHVVLVQERGLGLRAPRDGRLSFLAR